MPPDPPRRLVPSALTPPIFPEVSATDLSDLCEHHADFINAIAASTRHYYNTSLPTNLQIQTLCLPEYPLRDQSDKVHH